jgi:hypothetical protein
MSMQYYDLTGRNWTRKIQPHLQDAELNRILVRDFGRYTWGRWRMPFHPGMVPRQFESCDWDIGHRGCEATLAEPAYPWRIVTSDRHSTVWNGDGLLFDHNFLALGVPPDECFEDARRDGEELAPGKYMPVHCAAHYIVDIRRGSGAAS